MTGEVHNASLHGDDILFSQIVFADAAVHFECSDGGNYHGDLWLEACLSTFDIKKLFRAEVGAETGFGDNIVG